MAQQKLPAGSVSLRPPVFRPPVARAGAPATADGAGLLPAAELPRCCGSGCGSSRSLSQVLQIVATLIERKIRFIAIKEAIEVEGKQDLRTKVMIAMFGLFAEVERDLISERTKEGLAAAKAQGKQLGRPKGALGKSKLDGKEEDIRMLLGKEVSKASIAKILDVSRSALYHFIETRKIGPG